MAKRKVTCHNSDQKHNVLWGYVTAKGGRNVYASVIPWSKKLAHLKTGAQFQVYLGPGKGKVFPFCSPAQASFNKDAAKPYPLCRWLQVAVKDASGKMKPAGWLCSSTISKKGAKSVNYIKMGMPPKKKAPVQKPGGAPAQQPVYDVTVAKEEKLPVAWIAGGGVLLVGLAVALFVFMRKKGK